MFHHCKICVADFTEGGPKRLPPHPWAAPKKPILNRVKSESTFDTCLNDKELLAQSRHQICSLSYCNWNRTRSILLDKRTLNTLSKLVVWLSYCKYLSIRCMLLYFLIISLTHLRVNIHLILPRMWRNSLLEVGIKSEVLVTVTGLKLTTS